MTNLPTIFSKILSEYIKSKNIKTNLLAQYCGVDRSNMYKLISGKRNPGSEELVHKMADYMRLSPTETREILEAYRITVTGYETYYRRKTIQDFIGNFSNEADDITDISSFFSTALNPDHFSDKLPISGNTKLYHTIYTIIGLESKKEHGHIKLLFQPDSDDFMEVVASISKNKTNLKIDHIICLNNTDTITTDKRDYNLCCLQKIIPMYNSCLCDYTPFCYYDNIDSHNSNFNLLSSLVITSEYAITFSPQIKYGILFTCSDTLRKFHSIFDELKADTTPVVCKIDSVFTQFEYFDNLDLGEKNGYSYQMEPCIIPMIPLSFPEKYLSKTLPDRENFVQSVKQYIHRKSEILKTVTTHFMFTETGIIQFLKTGRLSELPDTIYSPFEYCDRVLLIRALINACKNEKYRMLRPDTPISLSNLCIYVTAHNGYLLFSSADGNLVFLNLEEPSLLFGFYDYLSSLNEDYFYPTDETVSRLLALIKKNHA